MPMLELDGEMAGANGVDSPTTEDMEMDNSTDIEDVDESEGETEGADEPNEVEPSNDDYSDISYTKAFSDRLKSAREKDTARIRELEEQVLNINSQQRGIDRLVKQLGVYGYEGSYDEIADLLEAQNRQITPEEVRAENEARQRLIDEAVANNPLVKQAEQMMIQNRLDNDLREIQQINPNIHSIRDLANDPNADLISAMVQTGNFSYAEAYKRLHKTVAPKVDTKAHLNGIGGGTNSGANELKEIPQAELSTWKMAFPELSLKDLKVKYNNSLKRQEEF